MTIAVSGMVCTKMTITTKAARPWKRSRATASAAANATPSEIATVASVTIRLLPTDDQK